MKYTIPVIILVFVFLLSSCTTHYYLVRHAEKKCEDCTTCPLTIPQGRDRAIALADFLFHEGVDTLIASQCLRTQLTAQPLADRLHKTLGIYQTSQLTAFIRTLKKMRNGRDVLVVSHSDQLPVIIDSLAHQKITISANDFDNLYVVTRKKFFGASFRLKKFTYGTQTR